MGRIPVPTKLRGQHDRGAYASGVFEKAKVDQNKDGENDFDDVKIARMLASDEFDSIEQIKKAHPALFEKYINEKKKKRKKRRKKKTKTDFDKGTKYPAYRDRPRGEIKKNRDLTIAYKNAKTEKQKQKIRNRIDRQREREAKKMKNENRTIRIDPDILREYIEEIVEAEKLALALEEVAAIEEDDALFEYSDYSDLGELDEKRKRKKRKKRKKKSGGSTLSKAVKKSLDKKADRRCLTRGSVYAEFRAGLGAYYSSGSRRGMSAHQWAHARVNSANPSKSWARVKKRKTCPKRKK